jgi:hypothetical protein
MAAGKQMSRTPNGLAAADTRPQSRLRRACSPPRMRSSAVTFNKALERPAALFTISSSGPRGFDDRVLPSLGGAQR